MRAKVFPAFDNAIHDDVLDQGYPVLKTFKVGVQVVVEAEDGPHLV